MLMDRTPTCRMKMEVRGQDPIASLPWGGYQGHGWGHGGMGPGWGRGQLIFYNCGRPGNYTLDCTNLTKAYCPYCYQFDREAVDFPMSINQMWEKGVLPTNPTQNVQMMKVEPCMEDCNVNMMLWSGTTTGEDKGKQPEIDAWVRKVPLKQLDFDFECAKENFREAKNNFVETSTSESKDQFRSEKGTSMLTTFLETCMNLLKDAKVVKELQELITRCTGADEPWMIRKLGKHALCTGWKCDWLSRSETTRWIRSF